jgi:hypothetical protein
MWPKCNRLGIKFKNTNLHVFINQNVKFWIIIEFTIKDHKGILKYWKLNDSENFTYQNCNVTKAGQKGGVLA